MSVESTIRTIIANNFDLSKVSDANKARIDSTVEDTLVALEGSLAKVHDYAAGRGLREGTVEEVIAAAGLAQVREPEPEPEVASEPVSDSDRIAALEATVAALKALAEERLGVTL